MKNTKEIKTIFAILFYLNKLGADDQDITNLLNYAFDRILDCNTNLLYLACLNRKKADCMDEINQLLREDTQYHQYIAKVEKRKNGKQ